MLKKFPDIVFAAVLQRVLVALNWQASIQWPILWYLARLIGTVFGKSQNLLFAYLTFLAGTIIAQSFFHLHVLLVQMGIGIILMMSISKRNIAGAHLLMVEVDGGRTASVHFGPVQFQTLMATGGVKEVIKVAIADLPYVVSECRHFGITNLSFSSPLLVKTNKKLEILSSIRLRSIEHRLTTAFPGIGVELLKPFLMGWLDSVSYKKQYPEKFASLPKSRSRLYSIGVKTSFP